MSYHFEFIIFSALVFNLQCVSGLFPAWSLTNAMLASTHVNEVDLELSNSVNAGAELAMNECANQFTHDVWNCPDTVFKKKNNLENNRETAYINAVISAGVTHTISRSCSDGSMTNCGCEHRVGQTEAGSWKWGGCSDNLVFGEEVSKQFLDTDTFGKQPKSLANFHNNQAGRIAVRKNVRTICKCHGVSGSCATKTCWRQLGDFQNVGKYLKKEYRRAAQVDYSNGIIKGLENTRSNRIEMNSISSRERRTSGTKEELKIKKRNLVFLQPSIDYCRPNAKLGYKGVIGRTYEVDPNSKDQTEEIRKFTNLCNACGLHVKKQVLDVISSCNCKFEWCCKISCQTCHKKKIRITCTSTPNYTQFLDVTKGTNSPSYPRRGNIQ